MKKALSMALTLLVVTWICAANEIVVNTTADSGTGTLRWALQTARSGDVVTFDPEIFPPDDPREIQLRSVLAPITQSALTVDGSNAGVIIDGSQIESNEWIAGLQIWSSGNTVRGLQVIGFRDSGIDITGGVYGNTIGGDRATGNGPTGQGCVVCECGFGIGLADAGTTRNTISGTLIGVDAEGNARGNRYQGVWIEGVGGNTVGPRNVIAYNGGSGIEVDSPSGAPTTITRNLIYSNTGLDIHLFNMSHTEVPAPVIVLVDLAAGSVTGTACPGCTVEIFSTDASGAAFFEGSTTSARDGSFDYYNNAPLRGTSVCATSTDNTGATSAFSLPTQGIPELQRLNEEPWAALETKHTTAIQDNRIGGFLIGLWLWPDWNMDLLRDDILGTGMTRAHMAINVFEEPLIAWDKPELSVSSSHDRLFTEIAEAGVKITYCLLFWDKANVHSTREQPIPRFKTEEEVERYLKFVRFTAEHFAHRVDRFEIWNEPSMLDCMASIDVEDYIALTLKAIPLIHGIAPGTKVVVGGTDFLMFDHSREYLERILQSKLMPLVDVVTWHPMYGTSPKYDFHRDWYYRYPSAVRELKELAQSSGFKGEFEAHEMCWLSPEQLPGILNELPSWPQVYSETECAKYYSRSILTNLGLDVSVTLGFFHSRRGLTSQVVARLCTQMAGHEAIDMPVKINIETDGPAAYCSFRYPNGDRIFAVWTDGIAQDEDPGVPATITFPGLTAETISGVDALNGFEQELVFEVLGGDTVIHGLLVKDYPILIRLSDVTMGPDYEETVGDGFHQLGEPGSGSANGGGSDRDGDGVPDEEDFCPDWPGSTEASGC